MITLTEEEKRIIIFVLILLLIGLGLSFVRKKIGTFHLIDEETIKKSLFRKVNINKASIYELKTIPNLGSKLAEAIFDYRENNGNFTELEDLKKVKGIKNKKFEEIKPYISLGTE